MKRSILALVAVLTAAPFSYAQTQQNPVAEHYRAYVAAMQRNDLAAGEQEAAAAVEASVQRSGDSGNTGPLLLNLATTQLLRGEFQPAVATAQHAVVVAQSGASTVNAAFAQLVLARAQLGAGDPTAAARLLAALQSNSNTAIPPGDAYLAAVQLGHWATTQQHYDVAQAAWAIADANSASAPESADLASAEAKTLEAAALIMRGIISRQRFSNDEVLSIHTLLTDAKAKLRPLAKATPLQPQLTLAQSDYAFALSWHDLLRAALHNANNTTLERFNHVHDFEDDELSFPASDDPTPICKLDRSGSPAPDTNYSLPAAVVLRVRWDATGHVQEIAPVASTGNVDAPPAVARAAAQWTARKAPDSPPNCTLAQVQLTVVQIVYSLSDGQ